MPGTQEELSAAMHRIFDALRFMRGPRGELIYVGEQAMNIAWHLARAGVDVHPEKAVIKPFAVPAKPGQMAGLIAWVPWDYQPTQSEDPHPISALAPDVDLEALVEAVPFRTRTEIQGDFA